MSLDDTHIRWADAYYRITNLVSWNGEAEWIAKPGSLSVDTQLSALANFRTVILGDIGAQSGQTVLKSIQDLKKAGIHVSRVLLGIASRAAVDRLKGTVPVSTVYEIDLLRWIELKDLLGLDGRLFKDNQGRVLRLPTWETSIRDGPFTEEKKREITALCKSYNRHIVSILGSFGFDQRLLPMHTL